MNREFKEGDKVRATQRCSGSVAGEIYTVTKHGNLAGTNCNCRAGWELVSPCEEIKLTNKPIKTFMNRVSIMMKKLLDADTQALVKAGLINGDLMLTSDGRDELDAVSFVANKAALVERANEIIAEAEKNK